MRDLRVLIFQGTSGHFVALCLEHDFAVQASTLEAAVVAFEKEYRARIQTAEQRGERPFQHGRRAPEEFWDRFEAAKPVSGLVEIGAQIRAAA